METGTVRPLMFGYLRVHQLAAGVTREEIHAQFEEFATAEGYALGGVFQRATGAQVFAMDPEPTSHP